MKIAVVGSGISGLMVARLLSRQYDVTVFEAAERLGGHTATKQVTLDGTQYTVDTGFIVFNDRTYPLFNRLLDELGIAGQKSVMSFSVSAPHIEYAGSNFDTLFCDRRNLLNIPYIRMLLDIVRFNKQAQADLADNGFPAGETLADYLQRHRLGARFRDDYLVPMGAAIWSCSSASVLDFPAEFFVRFFFNHGLLALKNRPQWYVIPGGSHSYIEPLTAPFRERIRLNSPVDRITRDADGVSLSVNGEVHRFDQVVLACHSDQALQMLADASQAEHEVLGALPYQENDVVLHTDIRLLPRNRKAWSSWNYHMQSRTQERATLSYNMNILQGIESPHTFCVTLNATDAIDPQKILGRYQYAHPVFSLAGEAAKAQWERVNGVQRTWYCGAWWANGFHEDGVASAVRVAKALGVDW